MMLVSGRRWSASFCFEHVLTLDPAQQGLLPVAGLPVDREIPVLNIPYQSIIHAGQG